MPIYEFECSSCSERFDRLQKLSDPDPDSCPNCGATGVRRRLTAPAFRLAGSGWYETDFKKDGDRKRNLAEKPESSPAEGKGTDSKGAEGKTSEAKGSEAKSGDAKSGEAKPASTKSDPAGTKPAAAPKAPAAAKAAGKGDAS